MLSRRLIRIKTFKVLFSSVCSRSMDLPLAEKELIRSCEKTRSLYYLMLNIAPAVVRVAREKIDIKKKKFRPTEEEANPNMKFVENGFTAFLENDPAFVKFCQKESLAWTDYAGYVEKLYASIISKDYYAEYMADPDRSFKKDCALFKRIFEEEFCDDERLEELLEEMSIYWIDDVDYVLNVILASIDKLSRFGSLAAPDVFFSEEDRKFAVNLLAAGMLHYDAYYKMVTENSSNWDADRLVLTDIVLIVMGLAEAERFEEIPVKSTINEYVEISKHYSTPNSKVFVNGLLDRLIASMIADGSIVKKGRGLYGGEEE